MLTRTNKLLLSLRDSPPKGDNRLGRAYTALLFVFSIAVITVCSKSSPLYPLNNWDDANCFFTVGKSVVNGQVMYRDIFEQKGPLLYFLYAVAYVISGNSFIGAYLIEIICCFFFLFYSAKIITLFCDIKAVLLLPLVSISVFAAPAFEQGGSAEELCLPMITYAFYVGLKSIVHKTPVTPREWIIVGITSGAVLWIKFSLLGFYIGCGAFMVFFYIAQKWHNELLNFFVFLMFGEFIISLPVLLYFIINDAVSDLFEVYFYCNMFIYPVREVENKLLGLILNIHEGTKSCLYSFGVGCGFIIAGAVYAFIRSKKLFIFVISSLVSSYLLIYAGGRRYTYYSLILAVFLSLGIVMLYKLLQLIPLKKLYQNKTERKALACICSAGTVIVSVSAVYALSPNTYMMTYSRTELPQYKFGEVISKTEDATLLNYKFLDGGFYTVGEVVPNCRFFCGLNIPYALDEQDKYIRSGKVDYVISCGTRYYFENYEYVCCESFESHRDSYCTYYLYKKKDSAPIKVV